MKLITEDTQVDFTQYSELSYKDNNDENIVLYVNGKALGQCKVWKDSEEEGREYICINHAVVYLDDLSKEGENESVINIIIDSFDMDGKDFQGYLEDLQKICENHGIKKVNIRFTGNFIASISTKSNFLELLKDMLAKQSQELGPIIYNEQDMLNAISYGFNYCMTSMHDNNDVPRGNKLQWLLYYNSLSTDAKNNLYDKL